MLHAAVLRSPHAHARIVSASTRAGRARCRASSRWSPARTPRSLTNPLPAFCAEPVVQYALAVDKVRFAGEAVAAVAAVDRYTAEDAAALIDVEYEPLPVAHRPVRGDEAGAPRRCTTRSPATSSSRRRCRSATSRATSPRADRVIRRRLRWHRASAQPLETAGAVCRFDPLGPAHGRLVEHQHDQLRRLAGRQHAQGAGEQAQHRSRCTWAAASAPSTCSAR